ncbi:hypothetical protein HAHI6034_12040 [Hathewaya histolytica]|uniref:Type I restriction enzyme EcoEI M protein HsdM n=2 Tax=Hathewaya histolytica TaxID=1498 RepID=A0A4V6KE86_HATHI|nr:type I restriction enzyme EcoEI M protein HsdM [Hathewaya histolytica]
MGSEEWKHFKTEILYGFDFDSFMFIITLMNLMLHSIGNPNVRQMDSLSKNYLEK